MSCSSYHNGCGHHTCNSNCHDTCGCENNIWYPGFLPEWRPPFYPCWCPGCGCECDNDSYCPYPEWKHPLLCNPVHFCSAENDNGPTLVIHQILLEPCGNQSCTPRTFQIRVTGPSYPQGEVFSLRAGSCTEIDDPLVIAGLTPGQYEIELVSSACRREYDTTFTGPICDGFVSITSSVVPTVITIVSRKRLTGRRCRRHRGCGCRC